eukprot:gene19643-25555_t
MFSLHPSFQDPVRVTETGWGEFEVSITIHFKDEEEEPITFFHQLKLYPPGPPQPLTTKKLPTSGSIASSNSVGSTSFIPGTTIPAVINNSGSNSLLTTGSNKRTDSKSRNRNPRPSKKKKESAILSTDSINIDTTIEPTSHPSNNTMDSSDSKIDISASDTSTADPDSKTISIDNQPK